MTSAADGSKFFVWLQLWVLTRPRLWQARAWLLCFKAPQEEKRPQVGHQEEFQRGKGGQGLEGGARGGLGSPSSPDHLEVSEEGVEVALSALGW